MKYNKVKMPKWMTNQIKSWYLKVKILIINKKVKILIINKYWINNQLKIHLIIDNKKLLNYL